MIDALVFLPLGGSSGKQRRGGEHERAIEASETGDWATFPVSQGWYAHLSETLTRHPGRVIMGAAGIVFGVRLFAYSTGAQSSGRGPGFPRYSSLRVEIYRRRKARSSADSRIAQRRASALCLVRRTNYSLNNNGAFR
jgi:hypothetical protein